MVKSTSITTKLYYFAILLFLVACHSQPEKYQGVWVSQGYGWVLDISKRNVKFYDELDGRCLENKILDTFLDTNHLTDDVTIENGQLLTPMQGLLYPSLRWDKQQSIDDICTLGIERSKGDSAYIDDPMLNFDWFFDTFERHYAFTDVRDLDIQTLMSEARQALLADPTQETLAEVIGNVISQTNDGHVSLFENENLNELANGNIASSLEGFLVLEAIANNADDIRDYVLTEYQHLLNIIYSHLDIDSVKSDAGEIIYWGNIADKNQGYILLDGMAGFGGEDLSIAEQNAALNDTLDQVMLDLGDKDRIIIDNRINSGGHDSLGYEIAKRFLTQTPAQLTKRYFIDGQWSADQTITVNAHQPVYTGEVFLLTSSSTVSAAETFTMVMRSQPNVTLIGEPTAGEFSNMLFKALPNGMMFSLSNEAYISHDGQQFESIGIPVDIEIDVFTQEQRSSKQDDALSYAIEQP